MSNRDDKKQSDNKEEWTIVEKVNNELAKGSTVDLKESDKYQFITVRKKEFIFSMWINSQYQNNSIYFDRYKQISKSIILVDSKN